MEITIKINEENNRMEVSTKKINIIEALGMLEYAKSLITEGRTQEVNEDVLEEVN